MSDKLKYYKPFILFFGIMLTTFGMFALGYFIGIEGERKVMIIILSLLGWYIGVLLLCNANSYKSKRRSHKFAKEKK